MDSQRKATRSTADLAMPRPRIETHQTTSTSTKHANRIRELHEVDGEIVAHVHEVISKYLSPEVSLWRRFLAFLKALHPWDLLLRRSHFTPTCVLASIRMAIDMGGMAVSALFFQVQGPA